ncbi:MAG: flavin reductase, partial [Verrucomicrobiota bacterium]
RETGEFVVNLVDEASASVMNDTSGEFEHEISEVERFHLETLPSVGVTPPRLAAAPVALECREWSTLEIGRNRLVIGLIDRIHTREGVLDPESLLVNPDAFSPIGRMEVPSGYCRTHDRFEMKRPD